MFNENIQPKDILNYIFKEMAVTINKLHKSGFPKKGTPPHSSGVYLMTYPDEEGAVGLARSTPRVLTNLEREDWTQVTLFDLETHSSENQHPIGGFVGTTLTHPTSMRDFYVGVLISPNGSEAVGVASPMNEILKVKPLWGNPFEVLPHLKMKTRYIPTNSEDIEIN